RHPSPRYRDPASRELKLERRDDRRRGGGPEPRTGDDLEPRQPWVDLDESIREDRTLVCSHECPICDVEQKARGQPAPVGEDEAIVASADKVDEQAALTSARTALVADPREVALPVAYERHRPVVELRADDLADPPRWLSPRIDDLHSYDVLVQVIPTLRALRCDPTQLFGAVLVTYRAAEDDLPAVTLLLARELRPDRHAAQSERGHPLGCHSQQVAKDRRVCVED